MPRSPDPLGKRALFWVGEPADGAVRPDVDPDATGRRALFSAREAPPGPVRVECSDCGVETRLSPAALLRRLPFSIWLPWRRHPGLFVCPACGRRTWLSVSLAPPG